MSARRHIGFFAAALTFPLIVCAHRLDEYLQATRLSLASDQIVLKIDLTPGVDTAAVIFASIDSDRDGRISDDEAGAYANLVLDEIVLDVDGKHRPVFLASEEFPSFQDMSAGIGIIRIEARAPWAGLPGRHSVYFRNDHRPELGVYLVNALVPESPDIEIVGQHRDTLQREFRLIFELDPHR